ncbi:hypothetical protein [Rodentibacter trehalosifermentans]|nr:hypothetical protein [Rodentibacter trehalosifermentans]
MKFPQKGQIQNILVKLKNFLIPQKIQDACVPHFHYTKYLVYRFKTWEHPRILKLVYLFFIAFLAIVAISISVVSIFVFLVFLLVSPLSSGKFSSHEESSDPEIVYYANGYEEDGVFYPDTGHENEPPQYS